MSTREGDGGHVWKLRAPEGERQVVLFTYADGSSPADPYPAEAFGRVLADTLNGH